MGEVYKARDTRLNRTVAVKILAETLALDHDRLMRFEREAKTLASLNHANIAIIHGYEESNGTPALIMELVDGPTLADRLALGSIPIDDVLQIAQQIAAALEAAHGQGIVHRDLKPANIKVRPDGTVKVLDFGLAKALSDGDSSVNSDLPTITRRLTVDGQILGTPAYMSPEQARGAPLDARTDVWSFGCVLYEMLARRRAFAGTTTADVIAAVLQGEPQWNDLPTSTPSGVRTLLRFCLQKDPANRLRSAGDIRILLNDATVTASAWDRLQGTESAGQRTWKAAALFATGALAATAAMAGWSWRSPTESALTLTLSLVLPHQLYGTSFALSPDGSTFVYDTAADDVTPLYVRALRDGADRALGGTEGGSQPFFSPDGQWIGFFAHGKLKKLAITGGAPVTLADALGARGGTWSEKGDIVFAGRSREGLTRVSENGGATEGATILNTGKGESSHRWPQILPGGKWVMFSIIPSEGTEEDYQIVAQSLESGERRVLVRGGIGAHYVPGGHLVYVNGRNLLAVPFDLGKLQTLGTPKTVIQGIQHENDDHPAFAISPRGMLVYVAGSTSSNQRTLMWVDRHGAAEAIPGSPRNFDSPKISPDGSRIVVQVDDAKKELWVYDVAGMNWERLLLEGNVAWPVWMRDGKRVAFATNRSGQWNIYLTRLDGASEQRLTNSPRTQVPHSTSPDDSIAFHDSAPTTGFDLWTVRPGSAPTVLLQTRFSESYPMFSPDGRLLAYLSDESGQLQVYMRKVGNSEGRRQVSFDGGREPVWSKNGQELFYWSGSKFLSVDVKTDPELSIGRAKLLFDKPFLRSDVSINYDTAPDGKRFVMIEGSVEDSGTNQPHIVLDWFKTLEGR
jgi:serine/threonine-protein kinase